MNSMADIINPDLYFEEIKSYKNIIMYGIGSKARQTINFLKEKGIVPIEVCDGNEKLWGGVFDNTYIIRSYKEIKEKYKGYCVVLPVAINNALEIMKELDEGVQCFHVCSPFKIESGFLDYDDFKNSQKEYEAVYSTLEDEISKNIFIENINYKLSGNLLRLHKLEDGNTFFDSHLLRSANDSVYIDVGAYTGDTVCRFLEYDAKYKRIIAIEADRGNFESLNRFIRYGKIRDTVLINCGAWSEKTIMKFYTMDQNANLNYDMPNFYRGTKEQADNDTLSKCSADEVVEMEVDALDHLLVDERPTLMKINAMAADLPILKGAENIIFKCHPDIILEYGVRPSYLIDEIKYIDGLHAGYRFYLRQKRIYKDSKTVLYAIGSDENA